MGIPKIDLTENNYEYSLSDVAEYIENLEDSNEQLKDDVQQLLGVVCQIEKFMLELSQSTEVKKESDQECISCVLHLIKETFGE